MGGPGSGRCRSMFKKGSVETAPVVDIDFLVRLGIIQKGERCTGDLRWDRAGTSWNAGWLHYDSDAEDRANASITFEYSTPWSGLTQHSTVNLTTTTPTFGGQRWWFECPVSSRRVRRLHATRSEPRLACRQVQNLVYPSTWEGEIDRAFRRARKTLRRAGGTEPSLDSSLPFKPARRHERTHRRLCGAALHERERVWDLIEATVAGGVR